MKHLLFLVILSMSSGACTGSDAGACGSDVNCVWVAGTCKAFVSDDCTIASGCARGCAYTPLVPRTCFDKGSRDCLGKDDCDAAENCEINSDGFCTFSDSVIDCTPLNNYQCPNGCQEEDVGSCLAPDWGPGSMYEGYCDILNNTVISQCASRSYCYWDTNTSKCMSENGTEDDYRCNRYSNSPLSECGSDSYNLCNGQGSACVYNSAGITQYCASMPNATQEFSECTRYQMCKVEDNKCVSIDSRDEDWCNDLDATETSGCDYYSSGMCSLSNNQCVPDLNSYCGSYYGDDCESDDICTLEAGVCVFAPNQYCGSRSTTILTYCTQYQNCKADGSQKCQYKTPDELCANYSIAHTYSECEVANWCEVRNSTCKYYGGSDPANEEYCAGLSTTPTVSECENRNTHYTRQCKVVDGVCKGYIPNCQLNQMGTACNNPPEDRCYYQKVKACSNVNCSQYGDSWNCPGYAGCIWSNDEICVSSAPLNCYPSETGECTDNSDTECTGMPSSPATCLPNTVPNEATCNQNGVGSCNGVAGCKWHGDVGGICYDKNCSNTPTYSLCCPDGADGCAYCQATSRPVDCPSMCDLSPTFIRCCPSGSPDCTYCQESPKPGDCPGGGGRAYFVHMPMLLLSLVLVFFL